MASVRWVCAVVFALLLPSLALGESDPYQQGRQALEKKDYDEAIACFTKAIEAHPKHAASYRDRGDAFLQKSKYDKALADLNEAIRLDPKDAVAHR
jgi:tetratricopeptide (TPR) repeat protein